MPNRNFGIIEVFYDSTKVLVNVSVKKVKQKGRSNTAKSMEELGGRKETFLAVLGKSEEVKGWPSIAKSIKKPGGGKKETSIVALSPIAKLALDPLLRLLFLANMITQISFLPSSFSILLRKVFVNALSKNKENKGHFRANWTATKRFARTFLSRLKSFLYDHLV